MANRKRSILNVYRTYSYIDKDPVIDEMRTLVQSEGLMKKLEMVHELSGVSTSTLTNWFDGETRSPQNRTVSAVATALGYERKWEKTKSIDIDKELAAAKRWADRQAEEREAKQKSERARQRRQAPGREDRART